MRAIIIDLGDCSPAPRDSIRLVPRLGPIREQRAPAKPTPEFRCPIPFPERYLIMAFQMTNTQQVELKIAPKNRLGKPAAVDGVPVWATDKSDVIALTPSADGMSCVVASTGVVGTANVQVTCDADLSDGVRPIIGTIEVTITPGEAQTIEIAPGEATEQN